MKYKRWKIYFWELFLLFGNSVPYAENSEFEEMPASTVIRNVEQE